MFKGHALRPGLCGSREQYAIADILSPKMHVICINICNFNILRGCSFTLHKSEYLFNMFKGHALRPGLCCSRGQFAIADILSPKINVICINVCNFNIWQTGLTKG